MSANAVAALLSMAVIASGLPNFPGAEGWGVETPGGRGGKVCVVTNLNARGPGSFYAALALKEPRIIVFRVSGVIDMQPEGTADFYLNDSLFSYVTVAGQTSPGGVTLTASATCGAPFVQYNGAFHDGVWRFVRFRADSAKGDHAFIHNTSHHFLLDHCDFSGGLDECLDLMRCHDFTVQWCTITNASPYAYLTGNWCSSSNPAQAYGALIAYNPMYHHSFHHNFMANHRKRGPEYGWEGTAPDSGKLDFVNNVIYNIEQYGTAFWGLDSTAFAQINVVGNYWKAGPTGLNFVPVNAQRAARIYGHDNYWEAPNKAGITPMAGDADTIFCTNYGAGPTIVGTPWTFPAVTTYTPRQAWDTVLALCGAWPRDSLNERTISDARHGTGRIGEMDEPFLVKGPKPPADADLDGMPDYWERARGLNPSSASDATGDFDASGYTNIEKYVNDLALVLLGRAPLYTGTGIDSVRAGVWEWAHVRVTVTDSATGLPLPGASVVVRDTAGTVMSRGITDNLGVCLFKEDAERYFLHISRDQYRVAPPVPVTLTEGETLAVAKALSQFMASGVRIKPAELTLAPGRSFALDVYKTYPDRSFLPLNEAVEWSVFPAGIASVDSLGVVIAGASEGEAAVVARWISTGFTDTCELTVSFSLLFVDFGASAAMNQFSVPGWDSAFKDGYTGYTSKGPAGTWSFGNAAYNYQGVRARDTLDHYGFLSGDTLKVTWHNCRAAGDVSFTPRISFNWQGRPGNGTWSDMTPMTLAPRASAASWLVFDNTTAAVCSLICVNSNYLSADTAEVICDKIELAFALNGPVVEKALDWASVPEGILALPNPFNPSTRILVQGKGALSLKIHDLQGRVIASLSPVEIRATHSAFDWNAGAQPSGVYVAVAQAGTRKLTKKLILMR